MVFSTVPLQSRWGNLHPEPLLKAQSPPPRAVLLRPPDPIAPAATGQAPLLPTGPSVSIHGPYPHTEHGKTGPLSHRGWGHPLTRRSPSVATAACVWHLGVHGRSCWEQGTHGVGCGRGGRLRHALWPCLDGICFGDHAGPFAV